MKPTVSSKSDPPSPGPRCRPWSRPRPMGYLAFRIAAAASSASSPVTGSTNPASRAGPASAGPSASHLPGRARRDVGLTEARAHEAALEPVGGRPSACEQRSSERGSRCRRRPSRSHRSRRSSACPVAARRCEGSRRNARGTPGPLATSARVGPPRPIVPRSEITRRRNPPGWSSSSLANRSPRSTGREQQVAGDLGEYHLAESALLASAEGPPVYGEVHTPLSLARIPRVLDRLTHQERVDVEVRAPELVEHPLRRHVAVRAEGLAVEVQPPHSAAPATSDRARSK